MSFNSTLLASFKDASTPLSDRKQRFRSLSGVEASVLNSSSDSIASMRIPSLRHFQRGVNLIEIMVAMVIGLFLVLGATTLYVNTKKTSDVDDSIARLQENARYALSIIETDVRMSNYWGLKKDGSEFDGKNSSSTAVAGATASNTYTGSTANALAIATPTNYCGANYATNVELYAEATNNNYGIPNCTANGTASASADTLTVRRVETATAPASGIRLQVCSTRNTSVVIRDAAATCPSGEIHNLYVAGYYIDQQSDQSSTYPSLRRKLLGTDGAQPSTPDQEVIAGVEDMQVEIGWDNSNVFGDPAGAVQYTNPGAGPANGRIVAVRVWLLIRAEQPDFTFTDTRTYAYADRTGTATATLTDNAAYAPNDNFRRLLVSRTFFIRNVTGT